MFYTITLSALAGALSAFISNGPFWESPINFMIFVLMVIGSSLDKK